MSDGMGVPNADLTPITIEAMLTDQVLHDYVLGDGDSPWAGRLQLAKMFKALENGTTAKVVVTDEWGRGTVEARGEFNRERLVQGVIRRAVQIWLQEHMDAIDCDAAIQLSVFDDIIFG